MLRRLLRPFRNKLFLISGILILLSVCLYVSYAFFVTSTEDIRVSELYVTELTYGVSVSAINDEDTSLINERTVSIPSGTTKTFEVQVTSYNPIDSKYQLSYNTTGSGVTVKYTDKTSWNPQAIIKGYEGDNISIKKVRVQISNTGSDGTVTFDVKGGYRYNEYNTIPLKEGYNAITNADIISEETNKDINLKTLVESNTLCDTTQSGVCYIGGDAHNNYVQYPESNNKTENLWRIIGTYLIDGSVVTKLIKENYIESAYTNSTISLNAFYNTLTNKEDYVYSTNKFLCENRSGIVCDVSEYSNIGLINIDEYNSIGGIYATYLETESNYFTMTEESNNVYQIKLDGKFQTINSVKNTAVGNLKPVIYIQSDVEVSGTGTSASPYIFLPKGDINISYTYEGQNGVLTSFPLQSDPYKVKDVVCTNGVVGTWNPETWKLTLSTVSVPTHCNIDFEPGYNITLQSNNAEATVDAPTSVVTGYNGTAIFNVSGSMTELNVTCDKNVMISTSVESGTGSVTISNIKDDPIICTIN